MQHLRQPGIDELLRPTESRHTVESSEPIHGFQTIATEHGEILQGLAINGLVSPLPQPFYYDGAELTRKGLEIHGRALSDPAGAIRRLRKVFPRDAEVLDRFYSPDILEPLTPKFWQSWFGWDFSNGVDKQYRIEKQATAVNLARKFMFPASNVLFLGCGDGREIELLYAHLGRMADAFQLYGYDGDRASIRAAKRNLQSHNISFSRGSFSDLTKHYDEDFFDCVVGVGVHCTQTLHYEQSVDLLESLKHVMKNQAVAIFTPYALTTVHRPDYETMGFEVMMSSLPSNFFTDNPADYYVVRNDNTIKPVRPKENEIHKDSQLWHQQPELLEALYN